MYVLKTTRLHPHSRVQTAEMYVGGQLGCYLLPSLSHVGSRGSYKASVLIYQICLPASHCESELQSHNATH